MTDSAPPVDQDEFAALMRPLGPYDRERRVMAAVSGGADSMAMALLLSRWGRPAATIVDHGLRAQAAAEAALTAQRLESLGIPATIVRASLEPGSAQAERARVARYDLLFGACARTGLPDLLLAHHAGDQAETVRMRLDAGSGVSGLSGMAPVSYRHDVRLLRPLLGIDPARLRSTLRAAGAGWVEDPSNASLQTARGRLRAIMRAADRQAALSLACVSAVERSRESRAIAAELATVRLAPEGFAVVPGRLGPGALSALIWMLSGRPYPPRRAALADGLASRTVHGILMRPAGRLGPGTLLAREPAALATAVPAADGAIWDGRFRLRGAVAPGLTFGALGADAARLRDRSQLPAVVLASLPALRRGDTLVAVPHLAFPDPSACRSVSIDFWPIRPAVLSA